MGLFDNDALDADLVQMKQADEERRQSKRDQCDAMIDRYRRLIGPLLVDARDALVSRGIEPLKGTGGILGWPLSGDSFAPSWFLTTTAELRALGWANREQSWLSFGDKEITFGVGGLVEDGPDLLAQVFPGVPRWDFSDDRGRISWSIPDLDPRTVYVDELLRARVLTLLAALDKHAARRRAASQ
ncbi:hypothetical protein [Microbacterium aurum]